MKTSFVALAVLISQAAAVPAIWKRQSVVPPPLSPTSILTGVELSSQVVPPPLSPTSILTGVELSSQVVPPPLSPTSILTGVELSSQVVPPPLTPTSPGPPGPTETVGPNSPNLAYPCPDGYSLTYVEEQQTYMYSFADLDTINIVGNWSAVEYWGAGNVMPVSGGNEIGAIRSRLLPATPAVMINETLVNLTNSDGFFQTETNLTGGPINLGFASLSNYSQVFQAYSNDSAGEGMSSAKFFSNICAINQTVVINATSAAFRFALSNIELLLQNATVPDVTAGPPAPTASQA